MLIYVCNTSCLGYTADIIPCLGFHFLYISFVLNSYQCYPVYPGNIKEDTVEPTVPARKFNLKAYAAIT